MEGFTCNLRGITFEVFTRKCNVLLTWKVYVVFTTNNFLRLYDEMCFSLIYDELARKNALRQTDNDETCFSLIPRKVYFTTNLLRISPSLMLCFLVVVVLGNFLQVNYICN